MIEIADIRCFARIAGLTSISAAARSLDLQKSTVSRALMRLERRLGTVLIDRSTRHLRLTDSGSAFREYALRILAEVDEAKAAMEAMSGIPSGTLRVSLPFTIATALVSPMLPAFMQEYPQVRVILDANNRLAEMPEESFDLVIRVGALPDSDLVARLLMTSQTWLCASPDYLAAHGKPSSPAQLSLHRLLGYADRRTIYRHSAAGGAVFAELAPNGAISDAVALIPAVLGGAGIAQLPDFVAKPYVADGRLIQLWSPDSEAARPINALYTSQRALSPKARVFIDALVSASAAISSS